MCLYGISSFLLLSWPGLWTPLPPTESNPLPCLRNHNIHTASIYNAINTGIRHNGKTEDTAYCHDCNPVPCILSTRLHIDEHDEDAWTRIFGCLSPLQIQPATHLAGLVLFKKNIRAIPHSHTALYSDSKARFARSSLLACQKLLLGRWKAAFGTAKSSFLQRVS